MNSDDIIRMAQESGWDMDYVWDSTDGFTIRLERFAALVAAAEREACAKVCEDRYMGDNNGEDMEAKICAIAIRARGE